ncbi:MAG: target of Sbf [Thelocarpon superellum]|nr:MAG: target of Sbf [Thelocarpon superellum]
MMRNVVAAGAVLAATISGSLADNCAAGGGADSLDNFYCQPVQGITYSNVGSSNSYNEVTSMNGGSCGSSPKAYSGPIAPLDEEVSLHFAGPLQLKQFGVYMPENSSGTSKHRRGLASHRRHGHQHFHEHHKEIRDEQEKRNVGDVVVATIDGVRVSWTSELPGATATPAAPAAVDAASASPGSGSYGDYSNTGSSPVSSWTRAAYYDSASQTKDGLVFLNHLGGQGSGVWDASFGNSLSFAGSDGQSAASSPQILADTTIPSNHEVVIFSDKPCSNGDCGFFRPGTDDVAFHGFDGASKIFVFEFQMPDDGQSGWNLNMPAIWILNAKIPRTSQFPADPACSCWASGCGEFDLFEILNSGNTKAKSTFHMGQAAGDSDYFVRPTGATIKAAVILDGSSSIAHIQVLDDSVTFGDTLSKSDVDGFLSKSTGAGLSTFALAA